VIAGIAPDPALTELTPDEIALHRIRSGEPIMGRDVDDSTIPQETGLVQEAVSFTKGCFLGQELVARIDSRGRVNRHLRRISLPDHVVPSGATVVADGVEVGTVGSVAATTDGSEALALLRREVEPGASVLVAGHMGTVDAVGGD
jgi:folate-binding protein YgfZ